MAAREGERRKNHCQGDVVQDWVPALPPVVPSCRLYNQLPRQWGDENRCRLPGDAASGASTGQGDTRTNVRIRAWTPGPCKLNHVPSHAPDSLEGAHLLWCTLCCDPKNSKSITSSKTYCSLL